MTVPGNQDNDAWSPNDALRVMQPAPDQDFEAEAKFDSLPAHQYQFEGILLEDEAGTGLRFDVLDDGQGQLQLFVGSGIGGSPAQVSRAAITDISISTTGNAGRVYIRVKRQGTQWTCSTSPDGAQWSVRSSVTSDFAVATIGVFAGNYRPNGDLPDFPADVDYFFNTSSPIAQEDAGAVQVPQPTLQATLTSNQLVISWPSAAAGFVLEASSTLAQGSWTSVPDVPTVVGDQRYANPGWPKYRIDQGSFSTDVQVGDVDRDGDLDVIIPKLGVGLVWYEDPRPKGDPARDNWKIHVISAGASTSLQRDDFHHDVEVADINGDGKLDVVTRGGQTRIFLQNNPDAWTKVAIPTGGRGGLALADLNGDGLLDIVENGYWLECPPDPGRGSWVRHEIASGWPDDVGVTVADINRDGRPDVLLAPAESAGRLSWFEAPAQLKDGASIEHVIAADVADIHTFKVADMNGDGELDVVTAEMEQSPLKRISIYFNEGRGVKWRQQVVATAGSHNLRLARLSRGGALSIVGANHGNNGAAPVIELWENLDGKAGP